MGSQDSNDPWAAFPDAPPEAAGPWDEFKAAPFPGNGPWSNYSVPNQPSPVYSGAILPLTRYSDGSVGFDSNAGLVGDVKRAVRGLPGLARETGAETAANTAAPQTAGQVANLAAMTTPGDFLAPGIAGAPVRQGVRVPTAQELHGAADAGYGALRNLDVHYDVDHVGSMVVGTQDALSQLGLSSEVAPKTFAVLNRLGNPSSEAVSVPLAGLQNARTILGRIGQGIDPTDRLAAKRAISSIDSFIQNVPEEAVLAGPASIASEVLSRANGNYAAAAREDKLNATGQYSKFATSSANSGANYDNTLRQQVKPLINPKYPQRLNGFTQPEKKAVTRVVEGSVPRNVLRYASSAMGGGGGWGAAMEGLGAASAGYATHGPLGAAAGFGIPVAGRALRGVQNRMARAALNNASELVRSRSPLYQERQAQAAFEMPVDAQGIAAVRAAAANQQPSQSQPSPTLTPVDHDPFAGQPPHGGTYAKGGKVKKPSHEFLVQRLMALAERAKRAERKRTAPILNMPDDIVTAALAKAHAAI